MCAGQGVRENGTSFCQTSKEASGTWGSYSVSVAKEWLLSSSAPVPCGHHGSPSEGLPRLWQMDRAVDHLSLHSSSHTWFCWYSEGKEGLASA